MGLGKAAPAVAGSSHSVRQGAGMKLQICRQMLNWDGRWIKVITSSKLSAMKTKALLYFALVLSFVLTGCSSTKFRFFSDKEQLTETNRVVIQVVCLEAAATPYQTFADRHFRIFAPPPRSHWSATFKVEEVIKGTFPEPALAITNAVDAAEFPRFHFEAGNVYTIGFEREPRREAGCLAIWPPTK